MTALLRMVARDPVLASMVIGLGAGFLTAAIRPIADADVLPYGLALHGFFGGLLGVGVGAFLVTGALAGREGVVDPSAACAGWSRSAVFGRPVHRPVGATLISLAIWPKCADLTSRWP
jgi:hypothetical protein